MLQYILSESTRWSLGELAQMAVEAGCRWISINLPDRSDFEIRELLVPDVVDLCRDSGVILTIDNRPELARELGLHGVRLSRHFFMEHATSALEVRESLGPEAIIGVEETNPLEIAPLVKADIDFVTLPADISREARQRFALTVASGGFVMPIVAEGCDSVEKIREALADKCNGLAVGRIVSDSDEPMGTMERLLETVKNLSE